MPALTNSKAGWLTLDTLAIVLVLTAVSPQSTAAGIKIHNVNSIQVRGMVAMTARIGFDLSAEALEALENGVALNIVVEIEALEQRRWLWDRTVAEHRENFSIERQALSKNYLVTHQYRRRSFLSLQEALRFIGTLRDYPLVETSALEGDERYRGRIRAWLDIESLPAPMRPTAYMSSNWRLSSDWVEWPIRS